MNIGVLDQNGLEFNARLRVLNTFILLSFCFAIPFELGMAIKGLWSTFSIFVLIQLWLIFCLILSYKKKYKAFKLFLYLVVALSLPCLCLSLGNPSGFYLYYFLFPLIAFNLYDLSEVNSLIKAWVILFISLLFTTQIGNFSSYPWIRIEPNFQDLLFHINFLLCIVFLIVMMYNVVLSHNKMYKKLESTSTEKDILLSEVHHRVKNNLAVISGLFRLQVKESNAKEINDFLLENSNRIHSMGLTHNLLYLQNNISKLEFDKYIKKLVNNIKSTYFRIENISISYNLIPVTIDLNSAVPFGLVINEIITNSIKHVLSEKKHLKIDISLSEKGEYYVLTIADDGLGYDPRIDKSNDSLGLFIIDSLIDQIDGKYEIDVSSGTSYSITFPKQKDNLS